MSKCKIPDDCWVCIYYDACPKGVDNRITWPELITMGIAATTFWILTWKTITLMF